MIDTVSTAARLESIASFRSAIRKSEKALAHMTRKGAGTTLIEKRLQALRIGLAVLECAWNQRPHYYPPEDLVAARGILVGLLPSIEGIYTRSRAGSPQRTLLKRRIRALELAVQAIDELSNA